jgi:hypothetical protein
MKKLLINENTICLDLVTNLVDEVQLFCAKQEYLTI